MTPQEFTTFLKSPESNRFSVEQIEKLLEQYPYSQSLRIAFLKKLRLSNHPDFEKHLHKTATYAYDRVFLKRYINKEPIYVAEYPIVEVEAEQLETLELVPLNELKEEKVENTLLDTVNENAVNENKNELTFPSENWEETIEEEELVTNIVDNKDDKIIETDNKITETVNEEAETDLVEEAAEIVEEEADEIEEVIKEVETDLVEEVAEIAEKEADEIEEINEEAETDLVEEVAEIAEKEADEIEEVIEAETDLVEEADEIEEVELIEESEAEKVAKRNKELQEIILESKKLEEHASIEEDIDNLLHEEELEELDDEIELGFEIDKKIINVHDDMSLFEKEEAAHGKKHDTHKEKPIHQIIHERINDHEETTEEQNIEKVIEEPKEEVSELSKDNIFTKDELHEESGLYFLDEFPNKAPEKIEVLKIKVEKEEHTTTELPVSEKIEVIKTTLKETEKDPEELPLQEEEEVILSTENVDNIRAVLSDKHSDKQTKKERVKLYLQRISKIPLSEIGNVTETDGKLLAKQGKIEHAIRLYQQLILKNPQKKVYFAAKIKQLIKKI